MVSQRCHPEFLGRVHLIAVDPLDHDRSQSAHSTGRHDPIADARLGVCHQDDQNEHLRRQSAGRLNFDDHQLDCLSQLVDLSQIHVPSQFLPGRASHRLRPDHHEEPNLGLSRILLERSSVGFPAPHWGGQNDPNDVGVWEWTSQRGYGTHGPSGHQG